MDRADRMLTAGEVAKLFRVDAKTVTRWAAHQQLPSVRTPGGHRRFRECDIRRLLAECYTPATEGHQLPRPGLGNGPESLVERRTG